MTPPTDTPTARMTPDQLQLAQSAVVDIGAIFSSTTMMTICLVLRLLMPEVIACLWLRMISAGESHHRTRLPTLAKSPN